MNNKQEKELLDPKSGVSSMRWALLTFVPILKWMLISTPIIALIELWAIKSIDWQGLALYISALGVFVGTLLGTKALQSNAEHKHKPEHKYEID